MAAEQLDVLTEENGQLKAENIQLRADLERATQQISELRRQLQIAASSRTGEHMNIPVPLLLGRWEGHGEQANFDEEATQHGALGLLQPGDLAGILQGGVLEG